LSSIKNRGQTDHIFTLTCDFQFQSPASHGSDPTHAKGQSVQKIEWKQTDGLMDGGILST